MSYSRITPVVLTLGLVATSLGSGPAVAQTPRTYWFHDSTDGDTTFVLPDRLTVDRQRGLIYLTDGLDQRVYVLEGRTGGVVRTGGRKGDGPGEYLMPGEIALSPDGTLLAVHDKGRLSVELLTTSLDPLDRRHVGLLTFSKGELLLDDTTVVLSGGHMPYRERLASILWVRPDGVTLNGPLPPAASDPTNTVLTRARIHLAGGVLARGRDGVLMAEAINGDVWLVGPDSKVRLARGPGGVEGIVEKFMRPVTVEGRSGRSPWARFPKAIYLEEEAPSTFLVGWSEADSSRFKFYRLRSQAAPEMLLEISNRIYGVARFDETSFVLLSAPEIGEYRIERREIRLPSP